MIDAERLEEALQARYAEYSDRQTNRIKVVDDFRESSGVRLVKWGQIVHAEHHDDEGALATALVAEIAAFERALIVGSRFPSNSVPRCFLKGHRAPKVFVARSDEDSSPLPLLRVRHIFGVLVP